jgi:ankyrin repeat protein
MQEGDEELVEADNAVALERRMEEGMDVDFVDIFGLTLLHWASMKGSVKCLRV